MTRKDFVIIANVLKEQKASDDMIESFIFALYSTNKNFNASKFRNACKN